MQNGPNTRIGSKAAIGGLDEDFDAEEVEHCKCDANPNADPLPLPTEGTPPSDATSAVATSTASVCRRTHAMAWGARSVERKEDGDGLQRCAISL